MCSIGGPVEKEWLFSFCILLNKIQPLFDVHLSQVGLPSSMIYIKLFIIPICSNFNWFMLERFAAIFTLILLY